MGMDAFLKDMNRRSIAAFSKTKAASQAPLKDTEETLPSTSENDTALFAGTENQLLGPGMEVGSLPEAECLTFRNRSGGDTLDAFAPLAQYTQRVHHGQMESTWMKVSKSITLPDGTVDWGIKEKDYIPEATRLLSTKVEDPLARREQFAVDQRKSRKKDLLAQRRGLFGNRTPIERSVSPMFGEAPQVDPAADSLYENDAAA
jgi:hypothetical protein